MSFVSYNAAECEDQCGPENDPPADTFWGSVGDPMVPGPQLIDPFETQGDWYVLHTKSRHEKVVGQLLQTMRIAYFLPLHDQVRFYGKRKMTKTFPLFPGYVFLRGTRQEAYSIDRTRHVASLIDVANQSLIDWELRNLNLALSARVPLDPYPYLQKGVRVEVRSGPMKGLQGLVESRLRRDRLILQVDMLGRAMGIEVDASLLEVME